MNTHYQEITELLFLGDAKSLEFRHFDMIVNCTKDTSFPNNYQPICIRISINDDPYHSELLFSELINNNILEQIHNNITNAKLSVLVHCSMGMQRSCAVVACYLIKYYNMTPIEAIEYIKSKRPIAFFGNINLLSAIEKFYNYIH